RARKDLHGPDGTCRKDDLAAGRGRALLAVLPPRHGLRALAVEADAVDLAGGLHRQVLPVQHRFQKPARSRPASASPLIDLEVGSTLVVARVEIVDPGNAAFNRRIAKGIEDLPRNARRLDAPFAAGAVELRCTQIVVFVALEDEQHTVSAPPLQAALPPD